MTMIEFLTEKTPLYNYKATITNVVDGDTVDAIIDVGFHSTRKERLRLSSIEKGVMLDAFEIRGPERPKGLLAKKFAEEILLGKEFIIHTEKSDVFGRWLAIIYLPDGNTFNEMLIKGGHTK